MDFVKKQAEINADADRTLGMMERRESTRESGRNSWDEKISSCYKVLLVCFEAQYLRSFSEMLDHKQFRLFFAHIDSSNSFLNTGSIAQIQAYNECMGFKFVKEVPLLQDNLLHLDTLHTKHEALGGVFDEQSKKYILHKAIKNSFYDKFFKESVTLCYTMDEAIPLEARISYHIFILRVKEAWIKFKVEETLEVNSSSSNSSAKKSDKVEKINVVKHSNKAVTKPKSNAGKKDLSSITCFACQNKGHYKGAKECPLYKPKTSSNDVQEVNLSTEFAKSTKGK
jgi:hypothetical protein